MNEYLIMQRVGEGQGAVFNARICQYNTSEPNERQSLKKMKYTKENPLRVVTLCSGYDSQCLALERLKENNKDFDYDLVAWSEIDKYAIQAHDALFPQWKDRNLGDMTKIDWSVVPDFDLLFYSTPCQSISQAGLQHGFEEGSGTRSSIIWSVRDTILAKHPKYLCLENVAAMVSSKFIGMFNLWQSELAKHGYVNFAKILNAKDYGVPQNRDRIFLWSIRDDGDNPKYHFPKPFKLEKRLKDVLEPKVDARYYLSDETVQKFIAHCDRKQLEGCGFKFEPTDGGGCGHAVTSRNGSRETDNFLYDE